MSLSTSIIKKRNTENSMKTIARLTGIGYLIIFIAGFYGNFYVLEGLVVQGDVTATFNNITNNPEMYRNGVMAFVIMVITDLILAWPLYLLLKATNQKLALASSLLRVINAIFFFVALGSLFSICPTLNQEGLNALETTQAIDQFNLIWTEGLLVFGVHLLLLGSLLCNSLAFPKIVGILVAIAGMGYLVDGTAQLLFSNYNSYKELFEMTVVIPGVAGELSLTLWLLIKGVRTRKA
tara:strand:- start:288 stop:998 length:711 start_codon:yes stop_codon:yes gene_type:complete